MSRTAYANEAWFAERHRRWAEELRAERALIETMRAQAVRSSPLWAGLVKP